MSVDNVKIKNCMIYLPQPTDPSIMLKALKDLRGRNSTCPIEEQARVMALDDKDESMVEETSEKHQVRSDISTIVNTNISVCLFVCLFVCLYPFFSAIQNQVGYFKAQSCFLLV